MDVTEASFQAEVVERSRELPVVVDFWAEWCGPCRALGPVLEREAEARADRVALAKVDVDANPGLATAYGVQGIPAVKAFRNGQVVAEFAGVRPRQAVAEFLDGLSAPSQASRLLEELRTSGELPEVVRALDAAEHERALQLLLALAEEGNVDERERVRALMVALFDELGLQHPLSVTYRRRLATVLY
jgi:putative thioredoxin